MKLKNKRTGEIADLSEGFIRDTYNGEMIQIKPVAISNKEGYVYGSLAELNEEWEDYEEPKKYWGIDYSSCRIGGVEEFSYDNDNIDEFNKEIGNYFETKEEAEKAVEKLRALKRLKDKGFRFNCYMRRSDWAGLREVKALENLIDITAYLPKDKIKETKADLELLFCTEENS